MTHNHHIRSFRDSRMPSKQSEKSDLAIDIKPMNRSLSAAKAAKQDEFYTQYGDIQKEVEAYLEFDPGTLRGKTVYCNCDDPFESNFFKYFAANFNKLGLKKLITTSYDGSPIAGQISLFPEYNEGSSKRRKPKAVAVILDRMKDEEHNGAAKITDVEEFLKRNKAARIALKGDPGRYPGGDFRSSECVAFLNQADIVVTNPPFSLFREYVAQLVKYGKEFIIVGPKNAVTYNDIFPLIKENKMWVGAGFASGNAYFSIPTERAREFANGVYDKSTGLVKFRNVGWFTNLDHGRRHESLKCMSTADNLKFSKHKEIKGKKEYERYENYNAIEVPYVDAIPSDYDGVMGVPISFLDKYNPDQFEIIANGDDRDEMEALGVLPLGPEYAANVGRRKVGLASIKKAAYKRILIRHRRPGKRGKNK